MDMRAVVCIAALAGAVAACAGARAEVLRFHATLSPVETPAAASRATGLADIVVDTERRTLSWRVTYSGLSGPVVRARFLAPAAPGERPGAHDMSGRLTSPIVSSADIDDIEIGDLRAGLWSVSLATPRRPQGEIQGDLEQVR